MGMAASQARYLALTARKTNTEWEGQQINQARTALANQSANLFNQLLRMEVPNPPKETDYKEIQYSYSDGNNKAVIEKWEQIDNNQGEYNYAVKHYYMADIFAGSKRQLQDPQIQLGDVLKRLDYDPKTTTVQRDASGEGITVTYKINNYPYEQEYGQKITQEMIDADEKLKAQMSNFETAIGFAKKDGTLNTDAVYGYQEADGIWHFFIANEYNKITKDDVLSDEVLKKALEKYEIENNLMESSIELSYDNIYGTKDNAGNWSFVVKGDNAVTEAMVNNDPTLKTALTKYETENGLLNPDGSLTYDNIYGTKDSLGIWTVVQATAENEITEEKVNSDEALKQSFTQYELANNICTKTTELTYDGIYGYKGADGWFFEQNRTATEQSYLKAYDNTDYYTIPDSPSYVGNSKLRELNKLVVDKEREIDQVADLAQILRDCPDDSINKYVSFDNEGNLVYEGQGIYTFDLNGKSYYTTYDDLMNCYNSKTTALNHIDTQEKLNYYNAAYINKKIEETNNALLETDGNGRFTSVKFDNDSLTYTLNFEEVTDEAAYQDAMNQYMYKKAQYEKTIADINAKTSIIQKEDRTLELRLKQLDTEQHALATEMDAVKKVIKDNVEKTFKTFSD